MVISVGFDNLNFCGSLVTQLKGIKKTYMQEYFLNIMRDLTLQSSWLETEWGSLRNSFFEGGVTWRPLGSAWRLVACFKMELDNTAVLVKEENSFFSNYDRRYRNPFNSSQSLTIKGMEFTDGYQ
jgi:hypothetical protein